MLTYLPPDRDYVDKGNYFECESIEKCPYNSESHVHAQEQPLGSKVTSTFVCSRA